MASLFYGFEIAKTGLYTSQKAISVTGHNIANANTVGYTRQRLVTESIDPYGGHSRLAPTLSGAVGGGVTVQLLDQVRNEYVDRELRRENASMGQWQTHTQELGFVEKLLDETSESSISSALGDFFNSLSVFSLDPVNKEKRTNVQQNAIKLTETFNHYSKQLTELQGSMNESMQVTVNQINDLVTSIADYNKQIFAYELSGEQANDIRDKRGVLLDELSKLVNIEYSENSDGQLSVSVEGVKLVDHTTTTLLEAVPDQTGAVSGESGFYSIYYEGTTTPFAYSDGQLEAYRIMRDGSTVDEIGIPRLLDNLNTLARGLVEEFNAVHQTGFTMPDGTNPSQTGIDFFEVPAGGLADVNAGNFSLSTEVLDNVWNIAASDVFIDLSQANSQQGNNKIALKIFELTTSNDLSSVGNFESFLNSVIVEVAIESSHCINMAQSQSCICQNLENRRQSISGVSMDEEMTQLITYQHSYSAASRMITAIDEALDVLINGTGKVGR